MNLFQPASKPDAAYHAWDPRYPLVARTLMTDIGQLPAGSRLEHVGSTAVPGCGGKGIIDLLALHPAGAIEEVKRSLLARGLSKQGPEFSRAWPESRPMYLGRYEYERSLFLIYVHVVVESSDEVRRFREFRDLLSNDATLVSEYCQLKAGLVAQGITDTDVYAQQKRTFFRSALGASHALAG